MNQVLDICESTQLNANDAWEKGRAHHYDWFCALEQTRGRGRRGNQWVSNRGNFFFSIILPEPPKERLTWSAMMGALAVSRSLPEFDIKLKWPNDLYLDGGKCGGVIAERVNGAIILGVGVNLIDEPALKDRVTKSLGGSISTEVLCIRVVKELRELWPEFVTETDPAFASLITDFNARSLFTKGDALRWISGTEEFEGQMENLGKFGELVVRTPTGLTQSLYSEDVFGVRSSI